MWQSDEREDDEGRADNGEDCRRPCDAAPIASQSLPPAALGRNGVTNAMSNLSQRTMSHASIDVSIVCEACRGHLKPT